MKQLQRYSSMLHVLVALVATLTNQSHAQNKVGLPTVGEVWFSEPVVATPYIEAFRGRLRELGYIDGRTITIAARFAHGDAAKLPGLIAELVAMKVDVLYVTPKATAEAMRATTSIPIVSMGFSDPVAEGVVASLSRPGANVTGPSSQRADTTGKRLELVKELVPALKRTAILLDPANRASVLDSNAFRTLAGTNNIDVRTFELVDLRNQDTAFKAISRYRPDVLVVEQSPLTLMARQRISQFAGSIRVPLVGDSRVIADSGALLTYGADDRDVAKRSAEYVDRILRGAKPSELPIEQPTKFELVVNLKTAKALGITIPESILLRADEVIR